MCRWVSYLKASSLLLHIVSDGNPSLVQLQMREEDWFSDVFNQETETDPFDFVFGQMHMVSGQAAYFDVSVCSLISQTGISLFTELRGPGSTASACAGSAGSAASVSAASACAV